MSVVLPTHNREFTIRRAVDSVLTQTYRDLELIVVDDSTDGTAELLQSISDARLRYVRRPPNLNVAASRNFAIRLAHGELVAFQDSDDQWLPDKLELQLGLLARNGRAVGAVGGRYRYGDGPETVEVAAPALEAGGDYEAELIDGHCLIAPLWLIRREVLEELDLFDETIPGLEDWDLMLRLSERTAMRAVAETVLIKYGGSDSWGGNPTVRGAGMEALLERYGPRFLAQPRLHGAFCLELAQLTLQRGSTPTAFRYALRALRRRGSSPATVGGFVAGTLRARLRDRGSRRRDGGA